MPMADSVCLWCRSQFQPRASGGEAQRFCSGGCRREFHTAARIYVRQAVEAGRLDTATLKECLATSVQGASEGNSASPAAQAQTMPEPAPRARVTRLG